MEQNALSRIERFKDLGFANNWSTVPDEVKQCQAERHSHLQLKMEGKLHQIVCLTCQWKFVEEGQAPLLPRVAPMPAEPEPPKTAPAVDEERIIKLAVAAALGAMEEREKQREAGKKSRPQREE